MAKNDCLNISDKETDDNADLNGGNPDARTILSTRCEGKESAYLWTSNENQSKQLVSADIIVVKGLRTQNSGR